MRSRDLTRIGVFSCACLFALLMGGAIFGQGDQARISGTLRDLSGAVIPGATITVTQPGNIGFMHPRITSGSWAR